MAVDQKLLAKLKAKHGEAMRRATTNRDPKTADRVRSELPDLDVAGNTVAIIIPKKRR